MRLVYCGTPSYAVPTLRALAEAGHDLALVFSQPDKPVGRAGLVAATPVKIAAMDLGIPVAQPATLKRNEDLRAQLEAIKPDAIIVVAYGRILPQWILDLPRLGCVNAHGSLLPRWRGAAPIQWAIASGDAATGVTTMQMDAGLDTGPMLLRRTVPIHGETTSPEMFLRLSQESASLMVETLDALAAGRLTPVQQEGEHATLAPLLTREDGSIDWTRTALEIERRFRAFQPWPGAFSFLRGKKLIVHAMHVADVAAPLPPGTLALQGGNMLVSCGGLSAVALDEVQSEGKRRMQTADFLRGLQLRPGELLG